jgi:hypothetical protein
MRPSGVMASNCFLMEFTRTGDLAAEKHKRVPMAIVASSGEMAIALRRVNETSSSSRSFPVASSRDRTKQASGPRSFKCSGPTFWTRG